MDANNNCSKFESDCFSNGHQNSQISEVTIQDAAAPKKQDLPTFEELRRAIPPQCFEKNLTLSLFYLALDYAVLFGLYAIVPFVEQFGGWTGLLLW
jgi:hypothetical protein